MIECLLSARPLHHRWQGRWSYPLFRGSVGAQGWCPLAQLSQQPGAGLLSASVPSQSSMTWLIHSEPSEFPRNCTYYRKAVQVASVLSGVVGPAQRPEPSSHSMSADCGSKNHYAWQVALLSGDQAGGLVVGTERGLSASSPSGSCEVSELEGVCVSVFLC